MNINNSSNSVLDPFLASLSRSLSLMPERRAAQEISEIRAHVEEIAAQKIQIGTEYSAAIHEAIAQMGEPSEIGKLILEDWEKSRIALRSKLISWMVGAAIIGAATEIGILLCQSRILNIIHAAHRTEWPNFTLLIVVVFSFIGILAMGIPVVVGVGLGKLMPNDSSPEDILPASLYAGLLLVSIENTICLAMIYVLHVRGIPLFDPGLTTLIILSLSAYASRAAKYFKLPRPNRSTWKLRID